MRALRLLVVLGLAGVAWVFVDEQRRTASSTYSTDASASADVAAAREGSAEAAAQPGHDPNAVELAAIRALGPDGDAEAIARLEALLLKVTGSRRDALACELAIRLNNRATRATRARDGKAADVDSARAITLCPTDATLKTNRANILFAFASHEDRKSADGRARARDLLERGLALEPDSGVAHASLAEIRYAEDDLPGAVDAYRKALATGHTGQNYDWQTRLNELEKKAAVEGTFSDRKHQHFVARFEGYAQERLAWLALDELEEAWFSIGRALDLHPAEPFTVLIYTGDQYARAVDVPDWSTGVFDGKIRVAEGQLALERGTLRALLRHEYTHAALSTLPVRVPTWMNEGLAEHFEGADSARAQALCAREAEAGSVVTWEELNGRFLSITDPKRAALAYATATVLVHALLEARGSYALITFITQLEGGTSFPDAFTSTFAVTPEDHYKRWAANL